jgi:hypothetical protein
MGLGVACRADSHPSLRKASVLGACMTSSASMVCRTRSAERKACIPGHIRRNADCVDIRGKDGLPMGTGTRGYLIHMGRIWAHFYTYPWVVPIPTR